MPEVFIGIDPGKKGAACAYKPSTKEVSFIDLKKPPIELLNWILRIKKNFAIKEVYIEDVHSLGGMSAKSNFSFGGNVREPHIILNIAGIKPKLVTPKVWQSVVGVTEKGKAIKQNVADLCLAIEPDCDIFGKNGGLLDGRSDARMITQFCYQTYLKEKDGTNS